MLFHRRVRLVVIALVGLLGVAAMVHVKTLHTQEETAREQTRALSPSVTDARAEIRAGKRDAQRLVSDLRVPTRARRDLLRARATVYQDAYRTARATALEPSLIDAYREQFLYLYSDTDYLIVRTRKGGDTTSWAAYPGWEYVIESGAITRYEAGTAPSYFASPPSVASGDFCSTHACIDNFDEGNGYVVQCADGTWTQSGGIQGACSHHGGLADPDSVPDIGSDYDPNNDGSTYNWCGASRDGDGDGLWCEGR